MSRRVLCSAVLLLIFVYPLLAQDGTPTPAPWPPDPEAIFAEGVQWSVYEAESQTQDEPVQIDYERDVIRVLNATDKIWREYPYSEAQASMDYGRILPNGLIWLYDFDAYRGDPLPGDVFLLDPITGVYTEPPTVCNGQVIQAGAGEGKWLAVYHDAEETEAFLCNSETGEIRDILPPDLERWRVNANPTGTALVLVGRSFQSEDYGFHVYSYSPQENKLLELGFIDAGYGDNAFACDWVSDTRGLICASFPFGQMGVSRFAFDTTEENSVVHSSYGWNDDTIRLEDPVRYVTANVDKYSSSRNGIEDGEDPCTVSVYDATGQRETKIGDDCVPILIDSYNIAPAYRQGDSLYFLARTSLDATLSVLTRFDIAQETTTEFMPYEAEIENIVSVSPDGRYVVLLTDDSNRLDFPWDAFREGCCPQQYGWFVTIVDTEADEIVYLSERLGIYTSRDVKWLDNETIVLASGEIYRETGGFLYSPPAVLRKIHLSSSVTTLSTTIAINIDSPNDHYGLSEDQRVVDLRTLDAVPLLQPSLPETYKLYTQWQEDGRLKVEIHAANDYTQSITYLVTLP